MVREAAVWWNLGAGSPAPAARAGLWLAHPLSRGNYQRHQSGQGMYKESHHLNVKGDCQALGELGLLAAWGEFGEEEHCGVRAWKEQGHLVIKVI